MTYVKDFAIFHLYEDINILTIKLKHNWGHKKSNHIFATSLISLTLAGNLSVFVGWWAIIFLILGFAWILILSTKGAYIFSRDLMKSLDAKKIEYEKRLKVLLIEQGATTDSIRIENFSSPSEVLISAIFEEEKKNIKITNRKYGIDITVLEK